MRKWVLLGTGLLFLTGATLVPSQQIFDRNGQELRAFLSPKETYYIPISLSEVSPWIIGALVAAEDKRFFEHGGVDSAAVLRAAWQNTQEGKIVSGASTLTQQLVRTLKPRPKTMWGKLKEAFGAVSLEQQFSKEEILEQYLNAVELGNQTQGVEAASLFYFNMPSAEISLAQAALLIGLVKSPTYYNPRTHLSRALERQHYVLKRMREENLIDEDMYQRALAEKITILSQKRAFKAPHFVQLLQPLLPPHTPRVVSTIDGEIQTYAAQTLKNHLARLSANNVFNGAVVVLENHTGAVLAYVGTADFADSLHSGQVDGAKALRQAGSALKPFVYGLTFEEKKLTPSSLLDDRDTFFEGGFRPRNYDEKEHGLVPVRTALASSYNIPAVRAAELVGTTSLLSVLKQLGLSTLQKPADFYGLGLSLGNGEVRLLDLTNAYAALARGGTFQPVQLSLEPQVYGGGNPHCVFSEKTAFLITDILADNHARMPAFGLNSPLALPFAFAAKTGTSKDYKDNFALGYTPRWTVGVWVGNLNASPMEKISGVTGAGPILHDVALFMAQKYPPENFPEPKGIIHRRICTETGLLAGGKCTHTQLEVFDENFIPPVCDGTHQARPAAIKIKSPTDGDIYKIDPAASRSSQQLHFSAICATQKCAWQLNGQNLPDTACQTWWPLTAGKHTLRVTCNGQTAQAHFEVLE